MGNIYPVKKSDVKVSTQYASIEANGANAKILTYAFAFMLVCLGVAALKRG